MAPSARPRWHALAQVCPPSPLGITESPMRRLTSLSVATLATAFSLVSSMALAAKPEPQPEPGDGAVGTAEGAAVNTENVDGTQRRRELDPGEIDRTKEAENASSPKESPRKTYTFIGARYRRIWVPKFMMNMFGDGGTTEGVDALGLEATIRRRNFEYVFSAWWADYSMDWTTFKAKSDPVEAYERVKSKMNVLYLTTDFNWTQQVSPAFGLNLGVGAGFGLVWGDLYRNQAYPTGSATDAGTYQNCTAVGQPNGQFCGNDNDHYGGYTEKSWSNGGSKPVLFPWLALQTGFRFKPHRNFMTRFDVGFGISGPFVGFAGAYGL